MAAVGTMSVCLSDCSAIPSVSQAALFSTLMHRTAAHPAS